MDSDTKIAILFIIINFCVAYVSDNVLNDLSKYSKVKAFKSLSPYFKKINCRCRDLCRSHGSGCNNYVNDLV